MVEFVAVGITRSCMVCWVVALSKEMITLLRLKHVLCRFCSRIATWIFDKSNFWQSQRASGLFRWLCYPKTVINTSGDALQPF